jgi:hypothetical protein
MDPNEVGDLLDQLGHILERMDRRSRVEFQELSQENARRARESVLAMPPPIETAAPVENLAPAGPVDARPDVVTPKPEVSAAPSPVVVPSPDPPLPDHAARRRNSRARPWPDLGVEAQAVRASPAASTPKVGRNEACPCGSGKKFKKCCWRDAAR